MTCPIEAIEHDDNNVVVDASKCDHCMACIPVCPTGSIDEWRVVTKAYTLEDQYSWSELPAQEDIGASSEDTVEALDDVVAALLAEAHQGAGGRSRAPATATKPTVNLYNIANPVEATIQGNYRLTHEDSETDVRHIILNFGGKPFPVLEGQSLGIITPGLDKNGKPHLPRLYSVSSPRDGERPNYNNVSLTIKREQDGICSNFICDLKQGDKVMVTGPFGATFLLPEDPQARILMICTGTGSAPMRAFTMRRQRTVGKKSGGMLMFFGARTPETLPYFGPLSKVPNELLEKHLVFSRLPGKPREYVQDRMLAEEKIVANFLTDPNTYIYICGLRGMEEGVEKSFSDISEKLGQSWINVRDTMREAGRYHVETY